MTPNLLMTSLSERACEPLQTFIKTISGGSTGGLDVLVKIKECLKSHKRCTHPGTLSQAVKAQLICNLSSIHGILALGQHLLLAGVT